MTADDDDWVAEALAQAFFDSDPVIGAPPDPHPAEPTTEVPAPTTFETAPVEPAPVESPPFETASPEPSPVETAWPEPPRMETAPVEAAPVDPEPVDTPLADPGPLGRFVPGPGVESEPSEQTPAPDDNPPPEAPPSYAAPPFSETLPSSEMVAPAGEPAPLPPPDAFTADTAPARAPVVEAPEPTPPPTVDDADPEPEPAPERVRVSRFAPPRPSPRSAEPGGVGIDPEPSSDRDTEPGALRTRLRPPGARSTDTVDDERFLDEADRVEVVDDAPQERRQGRRLALEWLGVLVAAVAIALLLRAFVVHAYGVESGSMENTLDTGDKVLVNKLSYELHGINHGDIVVFVQDPDAEPPTLIKRVVALEGETIEGVDSQIYLDGFLLDETEYISPDETYDDFGPIEVPEGHVFVMGDNRSDSFDSRFFGTVPEEDISGRAFLLYWPLNRLGSL